MCYCKAPWLLYKLGWINKSLSLTDWILLVEFIIYLQKSLHNYSNHLNTKHPNTRFIWILDSMGVWYSNGSVTWLGRQYEYRTFGPEIGFFSPVFRPPFKYRTIRQPNTNLPIEFQTSPVFGQYSEFCLNCFVLDASRTKLESLFWASKDFTTPSPMNLSNERSWSRTSWPDYNASLSSLWRHWQSRHKFLKMPPVAAVTNLSSFSSLNLFCRPQV